MATPFSLDVRDFSLVTATDDQYKRFVTVSEEQVKAYKEILKAINPYPVTKYISCGDLENVSRVLSHNIRALLSWEGLQYNPLEPIIS